MILDLRNGVKKNLPKAKNDSVHEVTVPLWKIILDVFMRDSFHFLKIAVQDLRTTGSITSSSKYLINTLLEPVPFRTSRLIVEFGAGDGCISQEILSRMHVEASLLSFELNTDFFKRLNTIHDKRARFVNANVIDLSKYVQAQSVDVIVSALPLSNMSEADKKLMLQAAQFALKPSGIFIQFQYSLGDYQLIKGFFDEIKLDFSLLNVPPAFVYIAKNHS
jgi:phospholipid N-methyltransferase